MAAKVSRLGGARQRTRARMRPKGNGIISDVPMFVPTATVITGDTKHARKHGWKNVRPSGGRRSHEQCPCRVCEPDYFLKSATMQGIRGSQTQVDDVHPLFNRPPKRRFEDGNGRREAVGKDLHCIKFDLRGLRSENPRERGTVPKTVGVIAAFPDFAVFGRRECDTARQKPHMRVLGVNATINQRYPHACPGRAFEIGSACHDRSVSRR